MDGMIERLETFQADGECVYVHYSCIMKPVGLSDFRKAKKFGKASDAADFIRELMLKPHLYNNIQVGIS